MQLHTPVILVVIKKRYCFFLSFSKTDNIFLQVLPLSPVNAIHNQQSWHITARGDFDSNRKPLCIQFLFTMAGH